MKIHRLSLASWAFFALPLPSSGQSLRGGSQGDANRKLLLGDVSTTSYCSDFEKALSLQFAFLARVVVASNAFAECLDTQMRANFYPDCTGEDFVADSMDEAIAEVIQATRNVNDLQMDCRTGGEGNDGANIGTFLNYGRDEFGWTGWLTGAANSIGDLGDAADDTNRFAPYPWPMTQGAEIVVHEVLHQHGYLHPEGSCSGFPDYNFQRNTVPYIAGACVASILIESEDHCNGGFCPSHFNDDLSTCIEPGEIQLMPKYGNANDPSVGACTPHFDPNMEGVGLLQFDSEANFVAVDMHRHGNFYGGSGWRSGSDNTFLGSGDLNPSNAGDEFLVTSAWGWGVIGWENGQFRTDIAKPYGSQCSRLGDGSGSDWTLESSATVIGIGQFSTPTSMTWTDRDEILVRSAGGLVLLTSYGSTFRTRNNIPWGTKLSGFYGHWTLGSGDRFVGVGDINGDGLEDVIVQSNWGIGILSRTGTGGQFFCLDLRPYGTRLGEWLLDGDNWIEAVADFNNNGRAEFLIRSPWGIGLMGIAPDAGRYSNYWLYPYGTNLSGGWVLQADDKIDQPGFYYWNVKKSLILRGDNGIAVLNFNSVSAYSPYVSNVTPLNSGFVGAGWWNYGSGNQLMPVGDFDGDGYDEFGWNYGSGNQLMPAGDFDGDGYDEFGLRSGWGYSIIGRSGSSATFRTLAIVPYGCDGSSSQHGCHGALFGSWMARETDLAALAARFDGGNKDYLLMHSTE